MKNFDKQLIEKINKGDSLDNYYDIFEDMGEILEYLKHRDYLHLINPFKLDDEYQNEVINVLLNDKKSYKTVMKQIKNILGDVIEENDEYYLIIDRLDELAGLFEDSRSDYSSYDIAKSVLGEDYWEPYWDTTDDVFRDVIEKLNDDNKNYLKQYILKVVRDKSFEIDYDTSEEMELIASEQGHDDYMVINETNIDRVVDDKDTMEYLMNTELGDLEGDLYSIHSNSYNSAYEGEVYRKVWNELHEFIDSDTKISEYRLGNKNRIKLKITNSIDNVILEWISNYDGHSNTIENEGYYLNLIKNLMDDGVFYVLTIRIPDYPDYRDVTRIINDIFKDYI